MKLGLLLNIIDPNIGGVLIMGDRGTGKSVAVRCHHALLSTDILGMLCTSVSDLQQQWVVAL